MTGFDCNITQQVFFNIPVQVSHKPDSKQSMLSTRSRHFNHHSVYQFVDGLVAIQLRQPVPKLIDVDQSLSLRHRNHALSTLDAVMLTQPRAAAGITQIRCAGAG